MAVFWRTYAAVTALIVALGAAVLCVLSRPESALSFGAGSLVSVMAVGLVGASVALYVRTGLLMARGDNPAGGRLLRGGLLVSRLALVAVGLALALSWRPIDLPAFAAGLGTAPFSVALAALRASR